MLTPEQTNSLINELVEQYPQMRMHAARGVRQVNALWTPADGTTDEMYDFIRTHFAKTDEERQVLYRKLEHLFETLYGASNRMTVELTRSLILSGDTLTDLDYLLGEYNPLGHMSDDLFQNKIAFITMLNFPEFTLDEKQHLAKAWNRTGWAYARMGDLFASRVPAAVSQQMLKASMDAENYIASYNIMMGHLLTEDGRRLFPEDMVLLSHWNLRDELKSNYADVPNANEKQEMIYQVMQRIVTQSIPAVVINSPDYDWAPYSNRVLLQGQEQHPAPEATARYERILALFHACRAEDLYHLGMPTAIHRNFEGGMQVSADEITSLFTQLLSSDEVRGVAAIIRQRLGRELRPYDIWYDGFKARSAMPEDSLTAITRQRYPDAEAFHRDMPDLLRNLGFSEADAAYYQSHIVVEPARGSGHAWECMDRMGDPARLRTRIGSEGMDYKGFNIAVHEFGHNVEQVTSLYRMDHYMLRSVPNTGFTEALAFLFQARDLQLLGYGDYHADDEATLDHFWSMYEIMGVSLVDMQMWQWLYAHPDATAAQLRDATLAIARSVWNQYYAPILGEEDSPILAIYSHMVSSPMYLPNYPYGHLVHFQLEEYLASKSKEKLAQEIVRIFSLGNLTPNYWMQQAVGADVSVMPVLHAVHRILEKKN